MQRQPSHSFSSLSNQSTIATPHCLPLICPLWKSLTIFLAQRDARRLKKFVLQVEAQPALLQELERDIDEDFIRMHFVCLFVPRFFSQSTSC
jgi:hypothetical protein